jgi:hypothetical protein
MSYGPFQSTQPTPEPFQSFPPRSASFLLPHPQDNFSTNHFSNQVLLHPSTPTSAGAPPATGLELNFASHFADDAGFWQQKDLTGNQFE